MGKLSITIVWLLLLSIVIKADAPAKINLCQKNDNQNELNNLAFNYKILSPDGNIKIPFDIYRDKIRFRAKVNGIDCHLTIDNGSLWDELLFFGSPKTDSMRFKITGKTFLGDSTVANPVIADVSENNSIIFDDIVFHEQKAIITRYIKNTPNLWEGIDGQVSAMFFRHFVVRINFDESFIELIPPEKFHYSGDGQKLHMHTGPENSRTIISEVIMHDNSKVSVELLIDLGGIHPLYLPIGKFDEITLPPNAIEAPLGVWFSTQKGWMGRVKSIKFGKYVLNDVVAAFSQVSKDATIYGNTMIGFPLLQRFNLLFNYPDSNLILEPARKYSSPFIVNMTGMEFQLDPSGGLKVVKVYTGSSAEQSGIKVNDVIIAIDSKKVSDYTLEERRKILRSEGREVLFDILRDKTMIEKIHVRLKQIY